MKKATLKNQKEMEIMIRAGEKLGRIKAELEKNVKEGTNAEEIEKLADTLIKKEGGRPSFKMVPGYSWVTCVNVNEGLVHGIPKKETIFKKGDVVSVDVGMFYQGFHVDTALSVGISPDGDTKRFLETGKRALSKAIKKARVGGRIYDISRSIEEEIEAEGFSPIRALVGHGVGRDLHEEPQIPCFTQGKREESPQILEGATLAIEVMYAKGKPDVEIAPDGWTILMRDGKISALFEETVAIALHGPLVLTESH